MTAARGLVIFAGLILIWQAVIWATGVEPFILPTPVSVAVSLWEDGSYLLDNAAVTLVEILLGLAFGVLFGLWTALAMAFNRHLRDWMLPILVTSQAIPVFALAPILMLWFGYGLAPKVVMATLITYFPVTAAFYDGLRRTDPGWLDLARTMGAAPWRTLRHVRLPSALPPLASGIRVATAVAPIGAIVGEWVGASAGLGHVMQHSKAQSLEPRMFAALFLLCVIAVGLYLLVNALLRRAVRWQFEADPTHPRP